VNFQYIVSSVYYPDAPRSNNVEDARGIEDACGIESTAGAESSVSAVVICARGLKPGTFTSTVERIRTSFRFDAENISFIGGSRKFYPS